MEEQRFWSRGDTGMTELLGVTAKIRSLRLSSKSSKMVALICRIIARRPHSSTKSIGMDKSGYLVSEWFPICHHFWNSSS